jgi:DNA replication protein DnaC
MKTIPETEALARKSADVKNIWRYACNLDPRFSDSTFENYDRKLQPEAYARTLEYCEAFRAKDKSGPLALVLASKQYGLGKTHLLAALVNRVLENTDAVYLGTDYAAQYDDGTKASPIRVIKSLPVPVYYVIETELLASIRSTYDAESQDSELQLFARLNRFPLLVIDDIGKTRARDLSFTQQVYYRLIEYRWSNFLHIALASNLIGDELEQYIGGAVASRLAQMTQGRYFLTMKGEDYRLKGINMTNSPAQKSVTACRR